MINLNQYDINYKSKSLTQLKKESKNKQNSANRTVKFKLENNDSIDFRDKYNEKVE